MFAFIALAASVLILIVTGTITAKSPICPCPMCQDVTDEEMLDNESGMVYRDAGKSNPEQGENL